ncbi:MAG: hypothetical protein IJR48_02920, partial [Oscillibacter sp.]|nr:hypothetical protein [Oscillibacter sp.]
MPESVPFLRMFSALPLNPVLRRKLANSEVTEGVIDLQSLRIRLRVNLDGVLSEDDCRFLREAIRKSYDFAEAELQVSARPRPEYSPPRVDTASAKRPANPKPASGGKASGNGGGKPSDNGGNRGKPEAPKSEKVLMGNVIKGRTVPMKELDLKTGGATVAGKVFSFESRET